MSTIYKITLKPLEAFFFGGESTFGIDDSRKESHQRYNATSTQFPQQTALLGMLRKTMLIQNGNLTMHKKGEWVDSSGRGKHSNNYEKAKALVGTEAFSYEHDIELGVIESLSPVFIDNDGEYFIANAKDESYALKSIDGNISFGNGQKIAFELDGFDAKESFVSQFISSQSKKEYSDFFEEVYSVGIKKSKDGKAEDDAFFRKKSYSPKKSATLCFIATFSEKIEFDTECIVSLGADQSSFRLKAEKVDNDFKMLFKNIHQPKEDTRIVLASETLLSKEAYDLCYFILGSRKSYRQLLSPKKDKNSKQYCQLEKGKKSKRYFLLEKGSVLFSNQIDKLEIYLNKQHLQNIGINTYFTIKGNKNVQK